MPNTRDSLDIKPALDKILKKLEKLDAIELTLRDMSSRLTKAETAVEKLEREKRKMNSEINTMDTGLATLNNEVSTLRGEIMAKEERINNLHMKHLYLVI